MGTVSIIAADMMQAYVVGSSDVGPTTIANILNKKFNVKLTSEDIWDLWNEGTEEVEEVI